MPHVVDPTRIFANELALILHLVCLVAGYCLNMRFSPFMAISIVGSRDPTSTIVRKGHKEAIPRKRREFTIKGKKGRLDQTGELRPLGIFHRIAPFDKIAPSLKIDRLRNRIGQRSEGRITSCSPMRKTGERGQTEGYPW
mgnify:CR=1 FL=1